MNTCTEICEQFKSDMETTSDNIISEVTSKVHLEEVKAINNNNDKWKQREEKMKGNHSHLERTNQIAIKNTKILTTKLKAAENRITQMGDTITMQNAIIDNMKYIIDRLKAV